MQESRTPAAGPTAQDEVVFRNVIRTEGAE
jgi:hypothetical protein